MIHFPPFLPWRASARYPHTNQRLRFTITPSWTLFSFLSTFTSNCRRRTSRSSGPPSRAVNLTDGIITYPSFTIHLEKRGRVDTVDVQLPSLPPPTPPSSPNSSNPKYIFWSKFYDSIGTKASACFPMSASTDWLLIKSFSRRLVAFLFPSSCLDAG